MKNQLLIFAFLGCMVFSLFTTSCKKSESENKVVSADAISKLTSDEQDEAPETKDLTSDEQEVAPEVTNLAYKAFGLAAPSPLLRQWSISKEDLANLSGYNPGDYKSVQKAINQGYLDEMSTQIYSIKFSKDGSKLSDDSDLIYAFLPESVPNFFKVEYENGLPVKFTYDDKAASEYVENGGIMMMDAYELALDSFSVQYDKKGLPASLKGKGMEGFFSGDAYKLKYKDYKFDDKGNWIQRTVEKPNGTIVQYRSYEY